MPNLEEFVLSFKKREIKGKKVKTLRKNKQIPASIFGFKGNFNITVDLIEFTNIFKKVGHSKLISLKSDNQEVHKVFISEVQLHPVSREFLHISFREVPETEIIDVKIPLILEGVNEAPAYKEDKQLIILLVDSIELRGKLSELPSEIKLDVSKFKIGDTLLVKDISLPKNVKFVHDDESSLNKVIVTTTSAVIEEKEQNVANEVNINNESQNI